MNKLDNLSYQDLLHLTALREVMGGFAHEIAQPLNAIMIASQVVQLAIERSALTTQEKAFLVQRLGIVSSQVARAGSIVDSLRSIIRGATPVTEGTNVTAVIDSVCGLMAEQLHMRGIEVMRHSEAETLRTTLDAITVECLIIHGLAFARESLEVMTRSHHQDGTTCKKTLTVRLFSESVHCCLDLRWNISGIRIEGPVIDPSGVVGLAAASLILPPLGGRLEPTASAIKITFP